MGTSRYTEEKLCNNEYARWMETALCKDTHWGDGVTRCLSANICVCNTDYHSRVELRSYIFDYIQDQMIDLKLLSCQEALSLLNGQAPENDPEQSCG